MAIIKDRPEGKMNDKTPFEYAVAITMMGPDENPDGNARNAGNVLECPCCGFECSYPCEPDIIKSEYYQAGWSGRGDLVVVPFGSECGSEWEFCFGFHKGNTVAFIRIRKFCKTEEDGEDEACDREPSDRKS